MHTTSDQFTYQYRIVIITNTKASAIVFKLPSVNHDPCPRHDGVFIIRSSAAWELEHRRRIRAPGHVSTVAWQYVDLQLHLGRSTH